MKNFGGQPIASLQGLRAVAFLMVLLGHCSVEGTEGLSGVAVSLFFVLSGFVSDYAYGSKELPNGLRHSIYFAWGRIRKLYILHLLLLAAMIVLEIFEMDGFHHNISTIVINVLLLQAWFPDIVVLNSFNGITWYLSASLFLYFCFPTLEKRIKKYKNSYQAICGIFFILLFRIIWSWGGYLYLDNSVIEWFQYFFPFTRVWEFMIGCHIGYVFRCNKRAEISFKLASVLETFTLLLLIFSWQMMNYVEYWAKYVVVIPVNFIAVYLLARARGVLSALLSNKLLVKLGNVSGYTYIIHYVVLRYIYIILYRFDMQDTSSRIVALITFVITLFLTYIWINVINIMRKRKYI